MLSGSKGVVVCLEFGEHLDKKQNRYAAGLAVNELEEGLGSQGTRVCS